MPNVENKHWGDIAHSPASYNWASYLVLGSNESTCFTGKNREAMQRYLMSSADTYIQSVELLRADPRLPKVYFVMTVEGRHQDDAMENSIAAAVGALASAHVRLQTMELFSAHLVSRQQLAADRLAAPLSMVIDARYDQNELGQTIFIEELELFADCMAPLNLN